MLHEIEWCYSDIPHHSISKLMSTIHACTSNLLGFWKYITSILIYLPVFQWYLLCKGNEWFGEIGNCTHIQAEDGQKSKQGKLVFGDIPFPLG